MVLKKITQQELSEKLAEHELWLVSQGQIGERANLRGVDLDNIDLSGVNLQRADLDRASLVEANLKRINLFRANLFEARLVEADLREANLKDTYLRGARLMGANLSGANLSGASLQEADLFGATLDDSTFYTNSQLELAKRINSNWLKNEVNDRVVSNKEIEELRKKNEELSERAKNLEEERRQGQVNEEDFKKQNQDLAKKNKLLEQQLTEAEEKARREITKDNIDKAIDYLKNPNAYIENQITIQNILAFLYGILALISFIVMIRYISVKYEVFGLIDFEKATIISWLFYVSPIILLGSLAITLINQVNHRLKRILILNERKRYVEAMGGTLKATVELTETDAEARRKIENYMNEIVRNTIESKSNVLNVEESKNDQVKSLKILDEIKSLLKE